jgi:hypothetical protein
VVSVVFEYVSGKGGGEVEINGKRTLLISRAWVQAAIIVFLIGFLILGILAYRTYTGEPPIPGRVVDPNGNELFTRADVLEDATQTYVRPSVLQTAQGDHDR